METSIAGLHADRRGSGPPMLLIHGIGHRWQMWLPVVDSLARDFEVVAVDLPGFGQSPPWAEDRPASLANGVDWLAEALDELGWDRAHVVGNSLGGWMALELATRGRALSVTALAPAGLWSDRRRLDRRLRFWFGLWVGGARRATPGMVELLRHPAVRTVALARLFGRPWRIPAEVAIGDARNLAGSAFDEVFEADPGGRFTGGRALDIPVTVTWCSRDPLFPPGDADVSELPGHARVELLRGCGHVPTWDDPPLVLETIRSTVAGAAPGREQSEAPEATEPAA